MRPFPAASALLLAALMSLPAPAPDQPSPPKAGEWRNLIGAKATGWRGFKQAALPEGWQVIDGALTRVGPGGDIVYGAEEFGDFEFEFEWKLKPKGNSGVFFRASETTTRMYENAPEYQILDNIEHPDNKTNLTVAGSNYALHSAPRDAVQPVGEWNSSKLVAIGSHVQHFLNGRKVVDYQLWTPDWEAKVKASKFVEWPTYGRAKKGLLGLQDHGDWVAYRNMRVKTRG